MGVISHNIHKKSSSLNRIVLSDATINDLQSIRTYMNAIIASEGVSRNAEEEHLKEVNKRHREAARKASNNKMLQYMPLRTTRPVHEVPHEITETSSGCYMCPWNDICGGTCPQ